MYSMGNCPRGTYKLGLRIIIIGPRAVANDLMDVVRFFSLFLINRAAINLLLSKFHSDTCIYIFCPF